MVEKSLGEQPLEWPRKTSGQAECRLRIGQEISYRNSVGLLSFQSEVNIYLVVIMLKRMLSVTVIKS
jgi:hypothetical protein